VFIRSAGVWTQQGSKLVGTDAVGGVLINQGQSVSLSSDGNTAIVGGCNDNYSEGAAWAWTRSGGVWTQQGNKLVGTGAFGAASQGWSVSLSSDGNTAIVGGTVDNNYAGAAWVWTRSGGVWTQQGTKLVGTGAVGTALQGRSVSLSSDGNTAIVGGSTDSSSAGAAWVFIRSGGIWTQQGGKLVGTGAVGAANQGTSVSLSSDGNTAIVGGCIDSSNAGAAWVWTRSGGVWTQQGSKLVGTGAVGSSIAQGQSVSLSSDGYTAIVGGCDDNLSAGAVWIYATPNAPLPVEVEFDVALRVFELSQNYPNPFNPSTEIKFSVATTAHAMVSVYNLLGEQVASLYDGNAQAGQYYTVKLDGSRLPSGMYLYRLQSASFVETKKLMLVK
jgi:hypothetical protein